MRNLILRLINISVATLFFLLWIEIIFFSSHRSGFPPFMLTGISCSFIIIWSWIKFPSFRSVMRNINLQFVNRRILKVILVISVLLIQIIVAFKLLVVPSTWDMYGVWKNAISLATTGQFHQIYFAMYPNNIGLLLILTGYCKLVNALLGEIPLLSAVFLNLLIIDLSILLIYNIANKIWGRGQANAAFVLCLISSPFYLYIPIFYTDTFSMLPMLGSLYFFVLARESVRIYQKVLLYFGCGVSVFIGFRIKGSVVIILIAILLFVILKEKLKPAVIALACILIAFSSSYAIYSVSFKTSQIIPEELFERYQFPVTHWIMMGLNGIGNFNPGDRDFTASFETYDEKMAATVDELKDRISKLGYVGVLLQFNKKASSYGWNYGTFFAERYLGDIGDQPAHYNIMHEFVLTNGKYHRYFYGLTQTIYIIIFLMAVLSMMISIKMHDFGIKSLLIIIMAGALVFFMIWETHPRYIFNFYPIMILLAADYFGRTVHYLNLKESNWRQKH